MSGIVVFGGTVEGRLIAEAFQETELEMHLCVATEYGATQLPSADNIHIYAKRMNEEEMELFLKGLSVDYCLDATHPYATTVTENIYKACTRRKLPYIRVLRQEGEIQSELEQSDAKVFYKECVEDAVEFLNDTTGNILITTGSRDLEKYTKITDYQNRCFARVLPTVSVVEKCKALGFEGKNLIGMQGPFGEELNFWMLKQIDASWMVTKNSGKEGGYQAKCKAALRAGVNILVIGRTAERKENVMNFSEVVGFLKKQYGLSEKRKVYLIGMGLGSQKLLTQEARECLKKCDVIIGAKRVLNICESYEKQRFYQCYRKEEILDFLQEHEEYQRAAIVYSGDIGFYSGAKGMKEFLKAYEVHSISGISSPVYFLNKLGIPWNEVLLTSCHGQNINLIPLIKSNQRVCVLIGEKDAVMKECKRLLQFHMKEIKITVGERLSYPQEKIFMGTVEEFLSREVDPLSVVLFENPNPYKKPIGFGIEDSHFVRGKVPMTKQEVRSLSLTKLRLTRDAVFYDIGAGTGSVSIEAALQCEKGQVYAIEKSPQGVRLIQENKDKFQVQNLEVIEGEAPESLKDLPTPTHVFIGGSGGRVVDIIRTVCKKIENSDSTICEHEINLQKNCDNQEYKTRRVRFVMNVVTLETMAQLEQIKEAFPEYRDMEVIQVNVARGRSLGRYHLMSAENPVFIVSFGGVE